MTFSHFQTLFSSTTAPNDLDGGLEHVLSLGGLLDPRDGDAFEPVLGAGDGAAEERPRAVAPARADRLPHALLEGGRGQEGVECALEVKVCL